jgi:hypothetical protein
MMPCPCIRLACFPTGVRVTLLIAAGVALAAAVAVLLLRTWTAEEAS